MARRQTLRSQLYQAARPDHFRIRHSLGSRDEPGDQLSGVSAPAACGLGPAVDSTVENGSDINGVGQGLVRNEPRQRRFNIETEGLGVAQSREQRTPGRAGCHGGEVVAWILVAPPARFELAHTV
jgi:hypothetical protein